MKTMPVRGVPAYRAAPRSQEIITIMRTRQNRHNLARSRGSRLCTVARSSHPRDHRHLTSEGRLQPLDHSVPVELLRSFTTSPLTPQRSVRPRACNGAGMAMSEDHVFSLSRCYKSPAVITDTVKRIRGVASNGYRCPGSTLGPLFTTLAERLMVIYQ